ncbi:MAG: hypothetical protein V4585_18235 [Bacteroidota bacterium]
MTSLGNILSVGKWEVKFIINQVEQSTNESYFLTLRQDGFMAYNQKTLFTDDGMVSLKLDGSKFKIISFNEYVNTSADNSMILNDQGVTEKDTPYIFDFKNAQLTFISGNTKYWYGLPFGIKKMDCDAISLFPLMSNKLLEIQLHKL